MPQAPDGVHDVYIGAGSNVGKRLFHLDAAVCGLRDIGEIVQCSPVYETDPVGYANQDKFLNMVVHLRTTAKPRELLEYLARLEQQARRERTIRFGPRTLDLDILLYDNDYYCVSDLQIPHPRMWERAFVIVPLADLTPDRLGLGGSAWGNSQSLCRLEKRCDMSDVFGRKLRAFRKLKNLTQIELAEKLAVSVAIVGSLERGTRVPTPQLVGEISRILQVSEDELFGRSASDVVGNDDTQARRNVR
ncbi:hypothetical protein GCM10025858_15980 [Alicyclobacillus sacchari]|nr:2-amino-4-hydroxy-6-hydroxymethyldihydropteridine diphosphokinase [Alicyclobacillus sacchari]GMA57095.1 hypothetical protein GCM10025858_15980 [Alicyclobacillus sacchari]